MTTAQQTDNYRLRYMSGEVDLLARPQVTSCAFCNERFDGTARDGILWAAAHRASEHPWAKDRGQAERRRAAKRAGMYA